MCYKNRTDLFATNTEAGGHYRWSTKNVTLILQGHWMPRRIRTLEVNLFDGISDGIWGERNSKKTLKNNRLSELFGRSHTTNLQWSFPVT